MAGSRKNLIYSYTTCLTLLGLGNHVMLLYMQQNNESNHFSCYVLAENSGIKESVQKMETEIGTNLNSCNILMIHYTTLKKYIFTLIFQTTERL